MKWVSANYIVDRVLKKINAPIKDNIEKAWEKIGDDSKKAKIVTLKNNILYISVQNSAHLQEISFKREEIIKKLNKLLNGKIEKIIMRVTNE